jgi:hypothetical protein
MLKHEPHVQNPERHRRNDEEVHGGERIAVVAEKDEPALDGIGSRPTPPQVPRDRPPGDIQAEHDDLAVDAAARPMSGSRLPSL